MTSPNTLKEVYSDELKDLWSANDQMTKVVKVMAGKAHDPKLKQALERSIVGIGKHADTLKKLLAGADEEVKRSIVRGWKAWWRRPPNT